MRHLRIGAIASTVTSVIASLAYVITVERDLHAYRAVVLVLAAWSAFTAVVLYCTDHIIGHVRSSTEELLDGLNVEVKALHYSTSAVMERYGDARAIDAIVATERRRVVNERADRTGEIRGANNTRPTVSPLRRRGR